MNGTRSRPASSAMAASAAPVQSSSSDCMPSSCRWRRSSRQSILPGAISSPSGKVKKKLEELEHLNQAATALVNDVAWWAKALKAARQADAVAEEVKAA